MLQRELAQGPRSLPKVCTITQSLIRMIGRLVKVSEVGRGYEFVYDGWKGVYKVGQEYHGEDKNDLFEGEFKIPMSWPISSIASWLTGFRKSYLLNETDARKREDAAKDTIIGLVFSTPQFL